MGKKKIAVNQSITTPDFTFMTLSKNQIQLLAAYDKLPEFQQHVCILFSLLYRDITQAKTSDCLNSADFRKLGYGSIAPAIVKQEFQNFSQKQFITNVNGYGYIFNPEIVELITRKGIANAGFEDICKSVESLSDKCDYPAESEIFRLCRIGLYRGYSDIYVVAKNYFKKNSIYAIFNLEASVSLESALSVLNNPFDAEFIRKFKFQKAHYQIFFSTMLMQAINGTHSNQDAINYLLEDTRSNVKEINPYSMEHMCEYLLLQWRFEEKERIAKIVSEQISFPGLATVAMESFLRDKNDAALADFPLAIKVLAKQNNKTTFKLTSFKSLLHFFAQLKAGESDNFVKATAYAKKFATDKYHPFSAAFQFLYAACQHLSGAQTTPTNFTLNLSSEQKKNIWTALAYGLFAHWVNPKGTHDALSYLKNALKHTQLCGLKWLELQFLDLIAKLEKTSPKESIRLKDEMSAFFLSEIITKKESWQLTLNALSSLKTKPRETAGDAEQSKRLVWWLHYSEKYQRCDSLQPVEQSFTAKKGWSDGRNIALKRLKDDNEKIPFITAQDRRVFSYINVRSSGYYGNSDYSMDSSGCTELAGHPLIFSADTKTRIEIEKIDPELRVSENDGDTIKLLLHPPLPDEECTYLLLRETPSRLNLIVFTNEHLQIARILGKSGLIVPSGAKEQVLNAMTALSASITIQSEIGGEALLAEPVEALAKPYVHLLPAGSGLKLSIFCRPFAGEGPYYRPGKGGEKLITEISGKKMRTHRNFSDEEKQLASLMQVCPTLQKMGIETELECVIEETEICLEALLELQNAGDRVAIEWPEGEKFRLRGQTDSAQFRMSIKRDIDWFSVNGELDLGNAQVLSMQAILELLDQTPGRFVKMQDGSFLALTEKFRKQLQDIRAYSDQSKDGFRFSPLIAPLLAELTAEAQSLKADKAWKEHVLKLDALKDFKPELPSTFQATLREYQLEGFEWMARLSHWGVGACLADDMGLGKTIQGLAILLTRAMHGPSLVVAPASVCMNWHSEAERFAPTLKTQQFGGKNREAMIAELKPYDLLVCSYGMLQQEDVAEQLKKINWQTIILDEAQAIKNMTTKRSQAVMNLNASFRLITTGTPIENHLGELWNLFRFLNPGLLGSLEKFNERFAIPIEKNKDKAARQRLKNLLRPFILRRMKNEVLDELPEKTEITLHVELSLDEKAFYEALRLNALKKLEQTDRPTGGPSTAGQKHLQILAEIMKLRRACCNVRLVQPTMNIPSAKLKAFAEIINELLENKHKALVFSQFVGHLTILKEYLIEKNIPFQYLDGSTPMKDRKTRVDAFQAGDGEIFLISLKAGGMGLNLTAADYVIHMDPWWNPAVEDQASDRAHRIGQTRPVTIYRIVAKDTIEEKIIELHKHKRDLATSLLDEADISGKISAGELMSLLTGAGGN